MVSQERITALGGQGFGHWTLIVASFTPQTGPNGRLPDEVYVNGVSKNSAVQSNGAKAFQINQIAGSNVEWLQILCYRRALTVSEITTINSYFANLYNADPDNLQDSQTAPNFTIDGIIQGLDIMEGQDGEETPVFVVDPGGRIGSGTNIDPAARLHLKGADTDYPIARFDNDLSNYVDFAISSAGVLDWVSASDASPDLSRMVTRPVVIPTANLPATPGAVFAEGELIWEDQGSGNARLLAVIDTDGAGTLGWKVLWST